ncbi:lipopolysaccharide biosynthesis protein [Vibrio cholerae]|uniref:hypothetical protein n=1 Tax=Vibrio cholerae TaxID=666 RepID=UPI001B8354AB|nr:hypothetical protein [Vibrio cholerae]EGR4210437.1 lipopolysaccharide biosynthesis protein [Vibrio cholerae]EIA4708786.1 hypothetical protein [Vibrio cholerae]MEB5553974.1 lipopolysaccharide biosynthesis protein [Vibrio cholerae]HBC3996313.1 hypothetical protein [Vibrio cholerae]
MSQEKNHQRIIKNSVILYFRMILTLGVTLYTSRVVLHELGIEDFGIFNVIGGVISMMAFLSGAMTSATQRFFSFELGQRNLDQLANVFKMSLNIHWLIVLIVIIAAETLGLWFINTHLVIPPGRILVANWIFQCSLFSFCCTVISVPYNAMIIAYEKMSAFAYISIIDVSLKLTVVFLLAIHDGDKLKLYGLLLSVVSLIIFLCYYTYARRRFLVARFGLYWNSILFKTLFSYTGWNLFGNLASVATNQGVNILLNMFFGASINAARAIAFQINAAITGFVGSLQTAINPQIVKSYASGNHEYMHQLIIGGSKYTFFLLYALALPVILQIDFILKLWLVSPPEYSESFCQLVLIDALITSLSGSLMASAQATGKIKLYQAIVGGVLLLNLPLSYLFLSRFGNAYSVFWISIATSLIALLFRLLILKKLIKLDIDEFVNRVLFRVLFVVILTLFPVLFIDQNVPNSIIHLLLTSVTIIFFVAVCVFLFGLERFERQFIKSKFRCFINFI